ncbi:MAG: VWD domain-containing protein [Lysobacteraceae bacterium]
MKITHISANIAVLALMASLADPAFAQVSRTPWQMHAGEGVTKLDVMLPSNGALPENDYIAFNWARIPGEKDGWRAAPNGETIAFGGPNASRIGAAGGACRKAVDYTYFQTIVDVPAGTQVDEFKIVFEGMDDASRITLFNSEHRNGKVVEGSYVTKASLGSSTATTDLRSLLRPGKNRVVITQVDWCPVGNQLQSAQVQLNGSRVAAAMPTELGPFIPVSHGDVHIRSADGLTYDFQAAGDYLYIQSTDGEVVVQGRQEMWDQNPKVSVVRAGAMRVMEDKIEWYMLPSRALYVNGKLTDLPKSRLALPAGGAIEVLYATNKQTMMVYWPDDIFVGRMIAYSNNTMDVEVKKVYSSPRTYEGLIGNMDRNSKNDLQVRGGDNLSGTTKENIARVGESWRVRANETLFTRSHPASTGASATNQPAITDLDANARATANQTCKAAGVTDATALRNCIYDVAATGDKTFVESARQFQETIAALPASERAAEKVEPMAVIVPPAAAAAASGVLFASGSILERGSRHTMSGHHLIFQDDGNLCVYKSAGHQFVWCINNDPSVRYQTSAKAEVTADGRLLVTNAEGGVVWQAPTANARPGSEVFITENGTLQMRTASGQVTWSSR